MRTEKVDLRKVHFDKSVTWNIWWQLGIDIDKIDSEQSLKDMGVSDEGITEGKLDVTKHYIPAEEQYRLVDYMCENYSKCKAYKSMHRTCKRRFRKVISWEILDNFPNGCGGDKDDKGTD